MCKPDPMYESLSDRVLFAFLVLGLIARSEMGEYTYYVLKREDIV